MSGFRSLEREVKGDIMKTDVFVKVFSNSQSEEAMSADIDAVFSMFRDFESRFSRFLPESELSILNTSSERQVSPGLFELLSRSKKWYAETDGAFDPAIASSLDVLGYSGSFGTDAFGIPRETERTSIVFTFSEVSLSEETRIIRKPVELKIDLGGIGKGFIVDQVAQFLREKYRDVFVYAGGDIRIFGKDIGNEYDFWAVDIENPIRPDSSPVLLLSDCAVATSGIGRRKWVVGGEERHHLIDPKTGVSADSDLFSVTVVAPTVEEAEIWSKTFYIFGSARAHECANQKGIPVVFIAKDGTMTANEFANEYLWRPEL